MEPPPLLPVLFVLYLEARLRDIRGTATAISRPTEYEGLPFEIVCADDTDFVRTDTDWLRELEPLVSDTLGNWALKVNPDKTEITTLKRSSDRIDEHWH